MNQPLIDEIRITYNIFGEDKLDIEPWGKRLSAEDLRHLRLSDMNLTWDSAYLELYNIYNGNKPGYMLEIVEWVNPQTINKIGLHWCVKEDVKLKLIKNGIQVRVTLMHDDDLDTDNVLDFVKHHKRIGVPVSIDLF